MALGNNPFFLKRTKEKLEKDRKEYDTWSFPYGFKQREKIEVILHQLNPEEPKQQNFMGFLLCKELYEKHLKITGSSEQAIEILMGGELLNKSILKRGDVAPYIALVLADAKIDERCEYPSVEEIKRRAQELEKPKSGKVE